MIRIPLYLDSAITGLRSTLAEVTIWNKGTGSKQWGDYGWKITGRAGQALHSGTILNWPRTRKTAVALLHKVLNDAYPPK